MTFNDMFPKPKWFSRTFHILEFLREKTQDVGGVGTLNYKMAAGCYRQPTELAVTTQCQFHNDDQETITSVVSTIMMMIKRVKYLGRTFKHGLYKFRIQWSSVDVFYLPPGIVNRRRNMIHTHTGEP